MGNSFSRAGLALYQAFELLKAYNAIHKRIHGSPGLPVPRPSLSFWQVPRSSLATHQSDLPKHADVVIIGSGITGASVARMLLGHEAGLKVVMLEARETCSGGTGRNGGHINPPLYHDYSTIKEKHGIEIAQKVIRFRLAHLREMKSVSAEEGILLASQTRDVQSFDVYYDEEDYVEAKEDLAKWKEDMPDESAAFQSWDGEEAIKRFNVSVRSAGAISGSGGAMHPYRFVTGLLSNLLQRYPDNFFLSSLTPCVDIVSPSLDGSQYYTVHTTRGTITTPHIVHATNGWSAHLLAPLRSKIIPARGVMSAQRPGAGLSPPPSQTTSGDPFGDPASSQSPAKNDAYPIPVPGMRSYVFYGGTGGYDYLTQLPSAGHELMFGGGFIRGCSEGLEEIGASDDSAYNVGLSSHLGGALPVYFDEGRWGAERGTFVEPGEDAGCEAEGVRWHQGRVKAFWSGILGCSADGQPWVGRVPVKLAGRPAPAADLAPKIAKAKAGGVALAEQTTAAPGEWIAAGYNGEGMVHAWMCGKAVACMILGEEAEREMNLTEWFPDIMRVTEKRWKEADLLKYIKERRG